jgi:hypothetical protein
MVAVFLAVSAKPARPKAALKLAETRTGGTGLYRPVGMLAAATRGTRRLLIHATNVIHKTGSLFFPRGR